MIPEGAETIRASSLPTWADCPRRWAATQRRRLLTGAGYDLRQRPPSIGAHVGTASHAGVARTWEGIAAVGDPAPLNECDDVAVEALRKRAGEEGTSWDRTTPDMNAAEGAARKILRAYRSDIPRHRRPEVIEGSLSARIGGLWYLTGTTDLFTEPDRACEDFKTGVRPPTPIAQIGAYSLMLVAGGKPVNRARMVWTRRVGPKTDQPPPMTVGYDVRVAMITARRSVDDIRRTVDAFSLGGDASPFAFRANPSSVLCGPKYCPAHGTAWCPESASRPSTGDDNA